MQEAVAAVGMFDGVHLGHRAILEALALNARLSGRRPLALTFATHPAETLGRGQVQLITPAGQKSELINRLGVSPVLLPFTKADFGHSASRFIADMARQYGVTGLVMGFNNHIGSDRLTATDLIAGGYDIECVAPVSVDGIQPNSTDIRRAIDSADIATAEILLGHRFTVAGEVVRGRQIGRSIGFPTANVAIDQHQLLPPDGAYIVDVNIGADTCRGMANIGTRPTLDDHRGRTLEVNIFDFDGDLYGRHIAVDFLALLRPEQKFPTLAALTAQLALDREEAKRY